MTKAEIITAGKARKAPKLQKCVDCGRIQNQRRCLVCREFIKAFTPNKHGEYA